MRIGRGHRDGLERQQGTDDGACPPAPLPHPCEPGRTQHGEQGQHRQRVPEARVQVGAHEEGSEHEDAEKRPPPAPPYDLPPARFPPAVLLRGPARLRGLGALREIVRRRGRPLARTPAQPTQQPHRPCQQERLERRGRLEEEGHGKEVPPAARTRVSQEVRRLGMARLRVQHRPPEREPQERQRRVSAIHDHEEDPEGREGHPHGHTQIGPPTTVPQPAGGLGRHHEERHRGQRQGAQLHGERERDGRTGQRALRRGGTSRRGIDGPDREQERQRQRQVVVRHASVRQDVGRQGHHHRGQRGRDGPGHPSGEEPGRQHEEPCHHGRHLPCAVEQEDRVVARAEEERARVLPAPLDAPGGALLRGKRRGGGACRRSVRVHHDGRLAGDQPPRAPLQTPQAAGHEHDLVEGGRRVPHGGPGCSPGRHDRGRQNERDATAHAIGAPLGSGTRTVPPRVFSVHGLP